jgi:hypothetical protein
MFARQFVMDISTNAHLCILLAIFREHKREQMKSKWNPHVALSHIYDCGQVKVEVSSCSELCLDCRLACGIRWRYVAHIWILFSTESSYPRRLLLRQPCLRCLTSPFILWLRRRTICGAYTLLNYNVHVNATADTVNWSLNLFLQLIYGC